MAKIPCPSCGEENFDSDLVCWKCGEPLWKAAHPSADLGIQSEPIAATQQMEAAQSDGNPAKVKCNPILAGLIGGLLGALAGAISCVPFWLQLHLGLPVAVGDIHFIHWAVAGALIAGIITTASEYGDIAGFVTYQIMFWMHLLYLELTGQAQYSYDSFPDYPVLLDSLIIGYVVANAALFGTNSIVRKLRPNTVLSALSEDSPIDSVHRILLGGGLVLFYTWAFISSWYCECVDKALYPH